MRVNEGLRTLPSARRHPAAQLTEFESWHKPKFTDESSTPALLFGPGYQFACGRDHIVGRRRQAGSSELPEAYAENVIGRGR